MIYVFFSYKEDACALRMSVARLREVDEAAVVYVVNDAAAPIPAAELPEGVRHVMSRYDRGGTGRGLAAVRGQLQALREIMQACGEDYVVKVDSDVWFNDVSFFSREVYGEPAADMLAFEGARALLPMGCAYRLSRWAVAAVLAYMGRRDGVGWQSGEYAEALTIWHVLALTPMRLRLVPQAVGALAGFYLQGGEVPQCVAGAAVVHCGEPHVEGAKLVRCTRELVVSRMLLLRGNV